jgi:tRNA(Ile)-lysidine synthase
MTEDNPIGEFEFVARVAARLSHEVTALKNAKLVEPDARRILIALSGGPDSTALTVAMSQLAPPMGWEVSACHINHGLRGLESDLDQEFCTSLCADLGVEFNVYRLDDFGSQQDANIFVSENVLRELRYRFLYEHARATDCQLIVAGHTLDDQTETLLFRLFRGTSPTGLIGMESRREVVRGSGIWLVRPMLNITKADCQRFLAIEQIGSHFDSSNENLQYARNFIRANLVPVIDEKFPGWKSRLERFRTIVSEQEDLLSIETEKCLETVGGKDARGDYLRIKLFAETHTALKRRIVAKMLRDRRIEPTFERVENILSIIQGSDTALTLSIEWEVRREKDKLRWLAIVQDESPSEFLLSQETSVDLPDGESKSRTNIVTWLDKSLKVEKFAGSLKADGEMPSADGMEVLADLSKITSPLTIRLRRQGDIIQPFGMTKKVKLKKYLHTHEPSPLKYHLVLADAEEVLWVPGVGISERLRFADQPTHRLTLQDLTTSGDSVWA